MIFLLQELDLYWKITMTKNQVNNIFAEAISEAQSIVITEDYLTNFTFEQAVLERIEEIGSEEDNIEKLTLRGLPSKLSKINYLLESIKLAKEAAISLLETE